MPRSSVPRSSVPRPSSRREVKRSINQYGVFPVTVSRVERLTDSFVRVSLTGCSLLHAAAPISDGTGQVYDAYIKLLIPPSGASGPTMIELDTSWRSRWLASPESERGHMRTYTVSNSRLVPSVELDGTPLLGMLPASEADLEPLARELPAGLQPEIDVDFVLHTDVDGHSGPGSTWAEQAQVGQQVSILAPLRGSTLWSSYNPGAASSLLLLGDETAAPALLSILRSLPASATGAVFLEVPGAQDALDRLPEVRQAARRVPGVRLHVLARISGQMRGHQLTRALRTACSLEPAPAVAPSDDREADGPLWHLAENPTGTYVLIAGESTVVKTLRRICVNEAGLPKESISFMGYWKAGQAEG